MIAINDLSLSNADMASIAGGWYTAPKLPYYKRAYLPVAFDAEVTYARQRSHYFKLEKAATDNAFVNKRVAAIIG